LRYLQNSRVENIYTIYIVCQTPKHTICSISNLLQISFASGSIVNYIKLDSLIFSTFLKENKKMKKMLSLLIIIFCSVLIKYNISNAAINDIDILSVNKIALSVTELLRQGTELEKLKDWEGALNCYKTILSISKKAPERRKAIKRIIGVCSRGNLDFDEVRDIINNELLTATGDYKQSLDYLLIHIKVLEALREKNQASRRSKIEEAIADLLIKAEQYSGTYMEVEMFCQIAVLYGDQLNDKDSAKFYADKAASIDPTYGCLYDAYASAGIEYHPDDYSEPEVEEEPTSVEETQDSEEISEFVKVNPNPLNPRTTISYSIKNTSHVKLVIYSITGQKVATLIDSPISAGSHSVRFDGSDLGSGVYLYLLESKDFTKTGKMLLLK